MVLGTAFGDVVQEHRHVKRAAVLDGVDDAVRERVLFLDAPGVDVGEHADRADQVLVDRVVVIHVELHHRHDAPEIGHEAAEHARLVHAPQHHFGRVARGEDIQEQLVRLRIVAHGLTDELERTRGEARGVGMDRQVVAVGQPEQADQVDRITLEGAVVPEPDAVVLDDEIVCIEGSGAAASPAAEHPVEHRTMLRLARLQLGANDRRQITHVLGGEEVGFHEPLDRGKPVPPGEADALGDLRLPVEGQALLGAAGEEVQMATHAPQELLAAREQPELLVREQARLDQLPRLAHAVDVFGDPEQGVEIAQAALPVLDVRLDEIARGAGPRHARIALLELGLDEFRGRALHQVLVEALREIGVERLVAEEKARLEQRGANGHVRFGVARCILPPSAWRGRPSA